MRWFLLFLFVGSCLVGHSQKSLNEIDLQRIPQKKIRAFILTQKQYHVINFKDIRPSCSKGEDLSGLNEITYTYVIKEDLQTVWEKYQSTSPADSWNGGMISFGLLFSKRTNHVLYRGDVGFNNIDTGQVFYVNLGILAGIYNLAVGLEITDINKKDKYVQFSYLKEGKTKGVQTIYFKRTAEGHTKIVHHTLFKSGAPFRDKILYPFFHKRAITEFHRNMAFYATRG